MIRCLSKGERIDISRLPMNFYGRRIISHYLAYGTEYDFCRFFDYGGGYISLFNASLTASGIEGCDRDELTGFVHMSGAEFVEIDSLTADISSIDGYAPNARRRYIFKAPADYRSGDIRIDESPSVDELYSVVSEGFDIGEYELWAADISHRIRHGVSKAYLFGGHTSAVVNYNIDGLAYAGFVCTKRAYRGRSYARRLLYELAGKYRDSELFLWAFPERYSFYNGIGFLPADEGIIFQKRKDF